MPYPGYLQDLSLLEDQECLLQISNEDTALTNAKILELELSCTTELPPAVKSGHDSSSTNVDLLSLMSGDAESEKDNSPVLLTTLTGPPSVEDLLTNTKFNRPSNSISTVSFAVPNGKGTIIDTKENIPAIPTESKPQNATVYLDGKSALPQPSIFDASKALTVGNVPNIQSPQPHLNQTDLFGLIFENPSTLPPSFAMSTPPVALPSSHLPTTLIARTTEDVIADLKSHAPLTLRNFHSSSQSGVSELTELTLKNKAQHVAEEEEDGDGDSEDSEDEIQTTIKPRKITERKRLLNAIADNFIQERNQKWLKESNKVRPEDESQQSAKWLVNQSEDRQIISTPREYQVELFEKAKEKNLIAVLDTGQ